MRGPPPAAARTTEHRPHQHPSTEPRRGPMSARKKRATVVAATVGLAITTAGCSGAGGGGGGEPSGSGEGGRSINVIMVNNPQMEDLQRLTPQYFTEETGIEVNFTVRPENDVRDQIQTDFSAQSGQYDVATISNYETPFFAAANFIAPLDDYISEDTAFDQGDILGPIAEGLTVDDQVYAEPFYGEGSFLMYRQDVFDAAGLTMPENPTWDEVAELAAQVDGAQPGMKGICLRGQAGWGQVFAPLTTVVNTFGGQWFNEDWDAQLDQQPFVDATQFYVDLVQQHGEPGAATAGFTECLNATTQGQVAMWYDATSAAGSLEADDSPVKGLMGYAAAPVQETDSSSWLYSWAFAMQDASQNKDAAWEFISFASSKEYEEIVAQEEGWASAPAGKRASTYENPEYQQAAAAFYEQTQAAIEGADPTQPGVDPAPAPGVQFVAVPQFSGVATQISQGISDAIAGRTTVDDALAQGQEQAQSGIGDPNKGS